MLSATARTNIREPSITFPPSAPLRPGHRARLNTTRAAVCRREGQYRAAVLNRGQHSSRARQAADPIVLTVVPLPISAAPHDTGVSGFVDVSKDTDRRDSVRNVERVHVRVGSATRVGGSHTRCETERFLALDYFNLGTRAAFPPFDGWRVSLKTTNAHTHDRGGGRALSLDAIGRPATSTGMRRGLPRPVRGYNGDVKWKASRGAISWAGDACARGTSACGHWVQACVAELDLPDLPGAVAGFAREGDDTLPTAHLRVAPGAMLYRCMDIYQCPPP